MTLYTTAAREVAAHFEPVSENIETGEDLFRIGDLARQFGISLRTLRFYEDKGLLTPKRDGVTRLYSRRDRARLQLILLGRRVGFSLRDVKHMIDLYDPTGTNVRQLRLALDKSEKQMKRLHKQRQEIDDAIAELSDLLGNVRQKLEATSAPRLTG